VPKDIVGATILEDFQESGAMATARFTADQVQLLFDLVDASRKSKEPFLMLRTFGGSRLQHDGFAEGSRDFDFGDAVVLSDCGLLTATSYGNNGTFHFVVSPVGLQAYEEWHQQQGDAADTVEDEIRRLVDSEGFKSRHPKAHECWQEAAKLLWTKDTTARVTDIGHHCREAIVNDD